VLAVQRWPKKLLAFMRWFNVMKTSLPIETNGLRGELKTQTSLAPLSSWRVGGRADFSYRPADINDLQTLVKRLPQDMPVIWLGLGSNTLVRDAGVSGLIILTQGVIGDIAQLDETTIQVGAGVACAQFARFCARQGLPDAAFLAGIPGTMGGALAMNAGACGGQTWDFVKTVRVLTRAGLLEERAAGDYQVQYRQVDHADPACFVSAQFHFQKGDTQQAQQTIRDMLARRKATQPINLANGGCVFRNPAGDHAGRLIESCGLKGFQLGGVQVSEKHANFFVIPKPEQACAQAVEDLIAQVKATVKAKCQIDLAQEVHIVGREQEKQ
jgi:UDP-N-acetylmuramate dehydrogenase